ncbi:MAG: response regulator [Bacteroidetes bacterium]|nr:response regulator [Bacteroidota bacterium]
MKTIKNKEELTYKCFDLYDMLIITTDQQGRIMMLNKTGNQLLDFEEQEMIGKLWADFLITDADKAIFEDFLHHYEDIDRDIRANRFRVRTKYGETKYIEFKMVAVYDNNAFDSILLSGKDITDHMNTQQDLYQSISLHRMLAASVPGINMYLFDTDMRFIIAEGSEMKDHGLSSDYFEGKTLSELRDPNMQELLEPLFKCALEGTDMSTELEFNKNTYKISVFPLFNKEGEIYGGMSISQNITDEKENARRLSSAKKEAEKANRAKSEFLANISHEIRTPLSTIVGFTEQLLKMEMSAKQRELTQIVEKSSEQLLELVEDLLILSRIEAGRIELDDDPFKIHDVLDYIYRFMKLSADEKQIDFKCEIDAGLKQIVLGDEMRLNQILTNLVGNAIKFTDEGNVTMNGFVEYETNDQLFVRFEVIDTGVGIAEDKQNVIFDQFRQADSAVTKKYGGTGLGLSISKRLVEAIGGDIKVKSVLGAGTTFTVTLPFNKARSISYYEETTPKQKIKFEGKKALLVDDDRMIRLLGQIILENLGFEVDLAEGGAEAIEILNDHTYDILVLDIYMPGVSGIDVANFLRQVKQDETTKILAVTAAFMKKDIQKYKAAGINDYMSKPFKENKLYNAISKLLTERKIIVEKSTYQTGKNKTAYDLSELRAMAGNDDVFLLSMLDTFTKNMEEGLEVLRNTIPGKDWKKAGEMAHKLLPSVIHLKLEEIIPLFQHLETMIRDQSETTLIEETIKEIIPKTEKVLTRIEEEKENLRKQ